MACFIGSQSPLGSVELGRALPWNQSRGPSVASNSNCLDSCLQGMRASDICSRDSGGSLILASADGNKPFQAFLADQMRSLEAALIIRHKQELDKVYDTIAKNNTLQQDQVHLNLDAPGQDSRQHSTHLEGDSQQQQQQQKQQKQNSGYLSESPATEAALELACGSANLAHIDNMEEKRGFFLTTQRTSAAMEAALEVACEATTISHIDCMMDKPQGTPQGTMMDHTLTRDATCTETFHLHPTFKGMAGPVWDRPRPNESGFEGQKKRVGDEMTDKFSPYVRFFNGHPLETRRWLYDMFILVVTVYDVVIIPLELTDLVGMNRALEILIAIVWSVDLMLGFFKGFIQYGVVELRLSHTASAYMRSWFLLDLTVVLLDWLVINLTSIGAFAGVARSGKALRFWRLFRMFRFVRMYKLHKFLPSGHTSQIIMWIVGMLILSHLIGCFWYLLGTLPVVASPSWVWAAEQRYMQQYGEEPDKLYFYLASLHWAVTQFTPASMEVTPRNSFERLYNLFTVIISLVLFPTFLSNITNNVAAWRRSNQEILDAKRSLLAYLQQNRISLELSIRIQDLVLTHYKNMQSTKRTHEHDVSLFRFLPQSLKEQLHAEVYHPTLITHPFLKLLADQNERVSIEICHVAMSQQSLKPGEELFAHDTEAEMVHVVELGRILYCEGPPPQHNQIHVPQHNQIPAHAGSWLCDQVLWMPWVHRGQMTAVQPCELANIDARVFRKVIDQHPCEHFLCVRFAKTYLATIQNEFQSWFNDLGCSLEELANIVGQCDSLRVEE